MPVDSVDNYTVFRVIHSIAFRSSVFCSADKVREVVETRFFESYRQMFKPVSTFRHLRIVNIRFSFPCISRIILWRKLFLPFSCFVYTGRKMDFANGFGFFFSKVIAGLSTSFVGLFDHLINQSGRLSPGNRVRRGRRSTPTAFPCQRLP